MSQRDPLAARRARAIRAKEWAQIWLDPSTFGLVVLMPLILMFLFGSAVTLDVHGTRTGVVDQDHTRASREFIATLDLPAVDKQRLLEMTPGSYTGLAKQLAQAL